MKEAARVVQRQFEAYNRRDLEAFLACYAQDARLYRPPNELVERGIDALRARYRKRFDGAPNLHATMVHRIVLDRFVVEHVHVTGTPEGPFDAIGTYEVIDGRIVNAWFCVP